MQIEKMIGVTKDSLILPACVMGGCDFHPRASPLTKNDHAAFVAQYEAGGSVRAAMYKKMQNKKWPVGYGKSGKLIGYEKMYEEAISLFRYPPVIREEVIDGTSTFMVLPLHAWPGFDINNMAQAQTVWTELIGFDAIAEFAEKCSDPRAALAGEVWCRTGLPLRAVPMPQRDGVDVPHGSMLDFDAVPLVLTPTRSLQVYLRFRDNPLPATMHARVHAVKTVTDLLEAEKASGILTPINTSALGAPDTDTHYERWEALTNMTNDAVTWSYGDTLLELIRSEDILQIDAATITSVFGLNNGVRRRAVVRVNSGHYDVTTWKSTTVKLVATGETVRLLSIQCTPSMKNEVYAVYLAFCDGKLLPVPSRCDCPNGQLFCSHMLGQLLLLYLLQRNTTWDMNALKLALPQPVKSVQGLPIAMQYAFGSRAKELQTEIEMKAILHGGHSVDDVEEEEEEEQEEEEGVVVEEEGEEEEGEEDEEEQQQQQQQQEEEDEEEQQQQQQQQQEEQEEQEEEEEDEDERIEDLAREEISGASALDICERMDKWSANAERFAADMAGNQLTGRKHDISGIHRFNHSLVYGKLTLADQRRRDEVHQRIAFLANNDEVRKNMMSIYVSEESIRERRHNALAETEKSQWLNDEYMLTEYKLRLGEIEGGANVRFNRDEEKKKRKKNRKGENNETLPAVAKRIKRGTHRNPGSGKQRKAKSKVASANSGPIPFMDQID